MTGADGGVDGDVDGSVDGHANAGVNSDAKGAAEVTDGDADGAFCQHSSCKRASIKKEISVFLCTKHHQGLFSRVRATL